jgi:hypothetical protein
VHFACIRKATSVTESSPNRLAAGPLPKPLPGRRIIGKTTEQAFRFSTPKFTQNWQRKNQKTYAQIGCEQVVGKLALKWFFGSQLLRPRSVLQRLRFVLCHVAE